MALAFIHNLAVELVDILRGTKRLIIGLVKRVTRIPFPKSVLDLYVRPVIKEQTGQIEREAIYSLINSHFLKIEEARRTVPSVALVYRVKDVENSLYLSVMSFAPLATEIIIVDNASSDKTLSVAEKIKTELSGRISVKIYSYRSEIASYGRGYLQSVEENPDKSIAKYYNFAFGKAGCEYVVKADGGCILMPFGAQKVLECLRKHPDVIYTDGIEVFGRRIDYEPRIFRSNIGASYVDSEYYESLLLPEGNLKKMTISEPIFIHIRGIFSYIKRKL